MTLRLIPKSEVTKAKSIDRQREVDEGVKLAKRVDALRALAVETEESYKKYRDATIGQIQTEINAKVAEKERETLLADKARTRRIAEEAPIDLRQEWEKVGESARINEGRRQDLLTREIYVSERENDVAEAEKTNILREKDIRNNEEWTRQNLLSSEINKQQADDDRKAAAELKRKALLHSQQQEADLARKDRDAVLRERNITFKEEQLEKDREDITNQKRFLADQRKTLERGFAELRRKQNG